MKNVLELIEQTILDNQVDIFRLSLLADMYKKRGATGNGAEREINNLKKFNGELEQAYKILVNNFSNKKTTE